MNDLSITDKPKIYPDLEKKAKEIGFTMPADFHVGALLKTLVTAKPGSNFLELGTGIGLSLSWIVDGMDAGSTLTTVDNNPKLTEIAKSYFGSDQRITIICQDGTVWIKDYKGKKFDLIFADAWPGKYSEIEEVLDLINVGGFYIVDDLLPHSNWPEGHTEKVNKLVDYLENRKDFSITKMNWSTGVIVGTKNC